MKKFTRIVCAIALPFAIGCSDETTVFKDDLEENVILQDEAALLEGAISYSNAGVLDIFEEALMTGKAAETAGDYPLTLIASVSPPSESSGDNLTASHVDLAGAYAFVSYNTVGETYKGAIDVVDVSDPHNPRLTSRLIYLNADVNALKYHNGFLYVVGGVDAETSVRATSNSFVARIPLNGSRMDTGDIIYGFQQGYNATDLSFRDGQVFVSSGKEGSITAYDPVDLGIRAEAFMADVRAMETMETGLAVLDAGSGIRFLDGTLSETRMFPVLTDLGDATKKTLDVQADKVLVAEAALGTGVYDLNSGALLEYLPIPIHPDGVDAADVVTNAVSVNEEAIFMANGGAGLSLSEGGENSSSPVGIIELDGSVNYVVSRDDYAFAAVGAGGLQIIKLNRPSESLESTCASLPVYDGSSKMVVNDGESLGYRGAKRLNNIIVGGELLLCGSWTARNHVNVQPGGLFELFGKLSVGRFSRRRNITVNEGSTLVIEGDVTIYGDLILNDGARLEFLGEGSTIDVFGSVKRNGDVQVSGTFRDVRSKFE